MSIEQNLKYIHQQICKFSQQCDRLPNTITLLAVTKTKPVSDIEQAIACGQRAFGENYVQEGVEKITYFKDHKELEWHFIGTLQSKKTRLVAEHFDWVQTLDRLKVATRLNEQRPTDMPPLNVLIQINISDEESKSGINPSEMQSFANEIIQLPHLKLRGLMAIPKPETEPEQQKIALNKMQILFQELKQLVPDVDTLSMGMSDDMQSAIECGSTMVRIGSAIFGARN
ncbi:YggS family pyridoxal phosphate-dependent enzyme [Phocoenobacter skyensis]|uniref:Pyridoxal phosphate homeostasis protein n=1 Tax=Phocoenobacter skyensis TaxID=97481 RepID=A0A1H7ZLL3_9PAST|nr:YggS family pyridoxal phosphate-dependent enzyme [Pasteurella skyensis]MDP8078941.1 YggS family pyridoxal phosphate-dependent enzyme [Pasteurella skyensis]MDP8084891.1 YggS family pyridoxal phosphate-dependent enzyme [Pasteurella skyensis]MDP8162887.1 YggS family pyridoxal phosphate-dependent enzyme [Pasteurella skyensis]MDP8172526.1 YggS family pyridoxal phosphate-dependent enzyme [Pasteurella skyensis]MDP8177711.1 YggS family pyridoxal phosphate-dependent enzyme [Pasteurella skyensis]